MQIERVELCVIGAGPAGLAAAEMGMAKSGAGSVVVVEQADIGGTLTGSVLPSMALSASARCANTVRNSAQWGIGADKPRINFARVSAHIGAVLEDAAPDFAPQRLAAWGIELIRAQARFIDRRTLLAGERQIRARRFVIATGSRALIPAIPGLERIEFLTPETAVSLTRRPGHLLILGGGSTGLTLAQAYLRLGCAVTLVDMLDPLAGHDAELRAVVLRKLGAEGIEILDNTGVVDIRPDQDGAVVDIKTGPYERTLEVSHVLVAAGRVPDLDALEPEAAGIKQGPMGVLLDARYRTSNPRIFCIGAASGDPGLAGSLERQALIAVTSSPVALVPLGFRRPPIRVDITYTDPEIARVGMTEGEAREKFKGQFALTRYPFALNPLAQANRRTDGHIKIVVGTDGKLLGASIVGPHAGEIAGLAGLAISNRLCVADLLRAPQIHTSYGQVLFTAAREHLKSYPPGPIQTRIPIVKALLS